METTASTSLPQLPLNIRQSEELNAMVQQVSFPITITNKLDQQNAIRTQSPLQDSQQLSIQQEEQKKKDELIAVETKKKEAEEWKRKAEEDKKRMAEREELEKRKRAELEEDRKSKVVFLEKESREVEEEKKRFEQLFYQRKRAYHTQKVCEYNLVLHDLILFNQEILLKLSNRLQVGIQTCSSVHAYFTSRATFLNTYVKSLSELPKIHGIGETGY